MSFAVTEEVYSMHEIKWTNNADRNRVDFAATRFSSGPNRFRDVSLALDLTKRGPGGMQAGFTKAVSTWYDVYVMSSTNQKRLALMAIPHASADQLEIESGYDYIHIRGQFLTNAAGEIYRFTHFGGWFIWNENTNAAPFRALDAAAAVGAAWTTVSLAGPICPHADQYMAGVWLRSAAGGQVNMYVRPAGSNIAPDVGSNVIGYSSRGANQVEQNRFIDRVDANQAIERQDGNANLVYMDVIGYFDPHVASST